MITAPYMMPRILEFTDRLAAYGIETVVPEVRERLEEADLLELVPGVHGVICGDDRFTRRVFEVADALKVISKWGTGIDSLDADAAAEHGVRICRTPNAFTIPVADSVFAYLLAFARRVTDTVEEMRAGSWVKLPGRSLAEQTLGVIGVGDIGSEVARRAVAFGMSVVACDTAGVPEPILALPGVRVAEHDEVFAQADAVTIHTDLNPTSYHLVDARRLELMKSNALVINTARGPVVDEQALVVALRDGRIGGAALDVFEVEPLPADSPLRHLPNVLSAPHNANSSPLAWERVHENSIKNLLEGLGIVPGGSAR